MSQIASDGYIDRASSDLKSYFLSGGYYGESRLAVRNDFSGGRSSGDQAWKSEKDRCLWKDRVSWPEQVGPADAQ